MNILLGVDNWHPNTDGVVIAVENYHKYLKRAGRCDVLVPDYKDEQTKLNHADGVIFVKSFRLPIFKGYYCPTPSRQKELEEKIKNGEYDILHAHSPFTIGEFMAKTGKKYGVPTVYTFHTKYKDELEARFKTKLIPNYVMKRIMRTISSFDYVFAVSEGSAETLRSYGYKGDIKVVRNGTDLHLTGEEREDELVSKVNDKYDLEGAENLFLYVGRLVEVKNIPFSLSVMKRLKGDGLKFKFLIVGEGEDREFIEKKAIELGLKGEVKFLGKIEDRNELLGLYLRSDLFLLPSVFDNASLTILESASGKLPSFVPKGSSISEVIKDGENGFAEELSVEKWAERIEKILKDKPALKKVGENAKKTVYRPWRKVADEVSEEYARIIKKREKG